MIVLFQKRIFYKKPNTNPTRTRYYERILLLFKGLKMFRMVFLVLTVVLLSGCGSTKVPKEVSSNGNNGINVSSEINNEIHDISDDNNGVNETNVENNGSSGTNATNNTITVPNIVLKTGKVVPAVSGLSYVTQSQNAYTDVNGTFKYAPEDTTITFKLGELELATLDIAETLEINQLLGVESIPEGNAIIKRLYSNNKQKLIEMQKLINFLVLIYSLDYDGDISNGIEIKEEVASLVPNLNLLGFFNTFRDDFEYLSLLGKIKTGSLSLHPVYVPQVSVVLQKVYQLLELETPYAVVREETANYLDEYTYNDLGLIETLINTDLRSLNKKRYSYAYNEKGLRVLYEYDKNTSTTKIDSTSAYTYDNNGNRIQYSTPSREKFYVYDNNFQQIEYRLDNGKDGSIDFKATNEYDENGNKVKYLADSNANGTVDELTVYTYTPLGDVLTKTTYKDQNQSAYSEKLYTYDSEGYLTLKVEKKLGVKSSEITYNLDGQVLTVWSDYNTDGIPDREAFYTYDSRANMLKAEESTSGDGNITYTEISTYNADNQLLTQESHSNSADNKKIYVYDNNGNQIKFSFIDVGKSTQNFDHFYSYDENNNRTRSYRLKEGSATEIFILEYDYDTYGNVIEKRSDRNGDGSFDTITTKEYAQNGGWFNLLEN